MPRLCRATVKFCYGSKAVFEADSRDVRFALDTRHWLAPIASGSLILRDPYFRAPVKFKSRRVKARLLLGRCVAPGTRGFSAPTHGMGRANSGGCWPWSLRRHAPNWERYRFSPSTAERIRRVPRSPKDPLPSDCPMRWFYHLTRNQPGLMLDSNGAHVPTVPAQAVDLVASALSGHRSALGAEPPRGRSCAGTNLTDSQAVLRAFLQATVSVSS